VSWCSMVVMRVWVHSGMKCSVLDENGVERHGGDMANDLG